MPSATAARARPGIDYFVPREVYTTGDVAALLRVARGPIAREFDAGRLGGFRLPPDRRTRRIPHRALVAYLRSSPDLAIPLETVRWAERLAALAAGGHTP